MIRTERHEVVEFDGPVLELMTDSRTRFDRRIAMLGPDIIAADFDERDFLRRLREDDPTRGIGDALLDQRIVAGIGNIWKCEACFLVGSTRGAGSATSATTRRSRSCARRARVCRSRRRRAAASQPRPAGVWVHERRAPLPALRHARARARPGRRQPHDLLVPPCQA